MEPQLPKPQFNPEAAPSTRPDFQGNEVLPRPQLPETQALVEQGRETRETMPASGQGDPAGVQPVFTPPPLPVISPIEPVRTGALQGTNTNPMTAADEDLIEKEWVEKAKKVVAETKDDPHAQDIAIGRLQADYLKKRYGKVIALPKEE